jgi:hypothetical protein
LVAEAEITPVPRLVGKADCILDQIPQANEATFVNTIAELSTTDDRLGIAACTYLNRSELLGDLGAFGPLSRALVRLHGTRFDIGVIPIIGPRTRAQLDDNLAATSLALSDNQLRRLDEASAIPLGFPHDMLAAPAYRDRIAGGKRALLDPPAVPVR